MRRDTIFYQLFRQSPTLLFELISLDELGAVGKLPIGLSLMVLTTLEGDEAKAEARRPIDRDRESTAK